MCLYNNWFNARQNLQQDLWSAKTQISLRIGAGWSESSLIACAFYSLQAIQRGINKDPYNTGWMYMLIWDFAGHAGLALGFVVRWSIWYSVWEKAFMPIKTYAKHVKRAYAICD